MSHAWFITGTDTEVGKTFVTCALLHLAKATGHRAVGMKPVAAGVEANGENDDVLQLIGAGNVSADVRWHNPWCLKSPIAPHIAAREEGVSITFPPIRAAFNRLSERADVILIEGVGGFRVPLGADGDSADLAVALAQPVILVVGMRLGCINHALLTAEAVSARGLRLAGWVANRIDPDMLRFEENLAALQRRLPAPLLGVVPYAPDARPERAASALRLPW